MRSQYTELHQTPERASSYSKLFSGGYDGAVWEGIEIPLIQQLLRKHGPNASLADLACGSGRIMECASPFVDRVDGFDVSTQMLDEATRLLAHVDNISLQQLDLTEVDQLPRVYDVISAFRLFLNADDRVRSAAVKVAYASLAKHGLFIANIHCVNPCPMATLYGVDGWLRETFGREPNYVRNSLSVRKLGDLLIASGFVDVRVLRYGYVPRLPFIANIIPRSVIVKVDSVMHHLGLPRGAQFALVTAYKP